jgi:DNA-binding beta-propeller fold protein YncE
MTSVERLAADRAIAVFVGATVLAAMCLLPGRIGQAQPAAPDNARAERDRGDGGRGSVWVLNRDLGELAIFDARSGQVMRQLAVGAGAHDICISEQAHQAYITAETLNRVTIVDTKTLFVDSIDVGPLPHHIEPSPDGKTIYVSLASHSPAVGTPQYATIDTDDHSVTYVTTSANPLARSHAPHPSRDGHTVYVAHDVGDELTAIDTATGTIDFSVGPIPRAEEAIPTRSGTFLWVSSRGDGTVKRIKIGRNAITASIPVGVQPESLMLTPSERTLVVSLRGTPATLAFVDTVHLVLEQNVQIGGAGTAGDLAVMTPDGRYVYATFDAGTSGTGGVAVVHVPTRTVVATWPYPGTGRPHGIWYSSRTPRF